MELVSVDSVGLRCSTAPDFNRNLYVRDIPGTKVLTYSNDALLLGWCLQLWCSSLWNVHPATSRSPKAWRTSGACNKWRVSWPGTAMPAERAWGETNHAGDNRSTERIRCKFLTVKSTVCNVIDNSQFVRTLCWKNSKKNSNSLQWTFFAECLDMS